MVHIQWIHILHRPVLKVKKNEHRFITSFFFFIYTQVHALNQMLWQHIYKLI